jgi:hypothetical protein
MSGSTSTQPYATPPLGANDLPLMEFIQPLPQVVIQLTFPSIEQTLAQDLTVSGVANTNTSGLSGAGSTEQTTTTTSGAVASVDTSQGFFGVPSSFG